MRRKISSAFIKIILLAAGGIFCAPILFLLSGSVMSRYELNQSLMPLMADQDKLITWAFFPRYPTFQHYLRILFQTPQFFVVFWNSMKIAALTLAGQFFIAVPAAWALARFEFRGKTALKFLYALLLILPFQVTMVSSYLVLDFLKLLDTYLAVILPGIFSALPLFILLKSFSAVPKEVIEAAKIDGAGDVGIFLRIGIPLGRPGIFSVLILGFLEYWNAVEQPLAYLKTESLKPLSLYLPVMMKAEVQTAFAASIITLLPAVLLFLCGQESLEKGIRI